MAEEPEVIRHQIDQTRVSLTEKLENLEGQVKGVVGTVTETLQNVRSTVENTVESVKSGVENTVETVKSSLNDTVDTVKDTFDLQRQVERHPWAALGCSFAAGLAAGYVMDGLRQSRTTMHAGIRGMEHIVPGYQATHPAAAPARAYYQEPTRPGLLSQVLEPFAGEFDKIKKTALGALVGIGRDLLKQNLPDSFGDNVTEIMDNVARRLGGEPVRGPVLEREAAGDGKRTPSGAY
jgi:ElaB/YqjD/DUF883 family membrane-anchored ribosome-binding protein